LDCSVAFERGPENLRKNIREVYERRLEEVCEACGKSFGEARRLRCQADAEREEMLGDAARGGGFKRMENLGGTLHVPEATSAVKSDGFSGQETLNESEGPRKQDKGSPRRTNKGRQSKRLIARQMEGNSSVYQRLIAKRFL